MAKDFLKRLGRPIWEPVMRRLDLINERLDAVERELRVGEYSSISSALTALRNDVWHSKVVPVGDRLLVGSRHLGMVFLIEADDRLIGPRFVVDGEYEPETSAFVLNTVQPTDVCIDVGANFGYYTCLMSRLAWQGRTISFEADPKMHALLTDNININWCERVAEPVNAAVADHEGELTLFRRVGRSGNTSIVEATAQELDAFQEEATERFSVRCTTLDALVGDVSHVDLVKIDVEGAESLVVAGMGELVRRHRPTIILEWSPWQTERAGFDAGELVGRLSDLGLVPHTLALGGATTPITYDALRELTYQNVVLRPS